jgi:hypothetical protein
MTLKRLVKPDHIPLNNFKLTVQGMIDILFISVSGLDEELESVDLPDRTAASGGNTKAGAFTAKQMMHHVQEVAALEQWYKASMHPVDPAYKKDALLKFKSISDRVSSTYSLRGIFPHKRVIPNPDMNDEGKAAEIEWTFRFDEIKKIPGM